MTRKQRTFQLAVMVSRVAAARVVYSGPAVFVPREPVSEIENEDVVIHRNNENNSTVIGIPPHLRECGIWLAPSAIQGAGLGMYAGKNYVRGESLQLMGDVVIPIVDRFLHNQAAGFPFLWEEYVWNGWVVGTDVEAYESGDGASPGFGSTANSFLPLVNVEEGVPKRDTDGLHRSKDPGAGAFSSYYDRQSTATRDISAGEEFYVDYGEHWFVDRKHFGPVPLTHDLDRATELFLEYENLKLANVPESAREELWETFIRKTPYNDSRVFGSFHHDDEDEMKELANVQSLKTLRLNQAKKTTEWLYKHGTCGDLIYGDSSTLEQAGRGAFASTDLPEGAIVTQLPLIHITQRSRLDMYYFEGTPRLEGKRLGKRPPQLLLNYCYGHNESTLLLCPYGPVANYVNHNQSLANVKIVWGDPIRSNFMPHLLDESSESLERDATAKLAFDMVAIKPIAEGEELFLDYGDSWEQSWQAHLASWKPVQDNYMSVEDFTNRYKHNRSAMFRTVFEQIEDPYPSNLEIQCNAAYFQSEDYEAENLHYHQIRREMQDHEWFSCEILRRYEEDRNVMYAALPLTDAGGEGGITEDLPEIAFRIREKTYSSDMFLDQAFRHEIHIPDEIFPEAWRNAKS